IPPARMPWLRMAWLWSWCFVALSLPLNDLLRSVRYQNAAGGDERCHTARAHSVPRGCARLATGHPPRWAHAVVVIGDDRDVHHAAAVRCRAQLRQNQGLELQFRPRYLVRFRLPRLAFSANSPTLARWRGCRGFWLGHPNRKQPRDPQG